ncbi:hypothetical protein OE88DRAFT_1380602 [Heliocybe sulcata]|uniref:DUF6534 domain-containing protein n=1 Tax=Heliocybe sulcata TaxID=5364 RepID=A0A5C3N4S1_9AGAM|nr:hypothetical protein OE88DRAFT_1380602 [Heliocybe sulcata]
MAALQNMDTTFGAIFIALVVSAVFYGVTVTQTYLYYRKYPNDALITKTTVLALWLLDTSHLILCTVAIYWYLVTNFGQDGPLDNCTWSMNIQADFNGLIAIIVQFYFARRVYILSENWIITSVIMILACVHFSLGIVFTVEAFSIRHFDRYPKLTWVTSTGLGCAAAADILIAMSMCHYLAKRRTGFKRTNSIIMTLMIFSINTGLLTSIIATACAITFAIMPTNFVWQSFFWVLGKCYVNSLLATLNSREYICEKARRQRGTFVELSNLEFHHDHAPRSVSLHSTGLRYGDLMMLSKRPPMPLSIAVETVTTQVTEDASHLSARVDSRDMLHNTRPSSGHAGPSSSPPVPSSPPVTQRQSSATSQSA